MTRIEVTVTFDGRILVLQRQGMIETVTPRETSELIAAMVEASQQQAAILGLDCASTQGRRA